MNPYRFKRWSGNNDVSVESQRSGQITVSLRLSEERGGLGLKRLEGVRTGSEAGYPWGSES